MDGPETFDLEAFLLRMGPYLGRILARFRIPPAEAEDLLQDAFTAMIRHWPAIQNPEAWLVQTVRSMCIGFWRRRKRRWWLMQVDREALEELGPSVPPKQEQSEVLLDLETLLATLPPRVRRLVILRFFLGSPVEEIAEELGYQPGSIRKLSARALARLQRSAKERTAETSAVQPDLRREML